MSNRGVSGDLADPRKFRYRSGCGRLVQSYGLLKGLLEGEGLHQHHLIPKSLFRYGPQWGRALGDFVPSVPLAEAEHLATLHPVLNEYLKEHGLWQRPLSDGELEKAIELTAGFYAERGLRHFAAAIHEFQARVYRVARPRGE